MFFFVRKVNSSRWNRVHISRACSASSLWNLTYHLQLVFCRKRDSQWKLRRVLVGWAMWTLAGFLRRLSMSWVGFYFLPQQLLERWSFARVNVLFSITQLFWPLHPVLQTRLPLKHLHGNEPTGQLEPINKTVRFHPSLYGPTGFQSSFPHHSYPIAIYMEHFWNPISVPSNEFKISACWCHDQRASWTLTGYSDTNKTELQFIFKGTFFLSVCMCVNGDKK